MPRPPRLIVPGVTYHLISRFVAREFFITSERERSTYLALLGAALTRTTWRCLGYAVMSNHIHLAMVAGADPLRDWIRRVHGPFAESVNRDRKRIGALFVRGPKAIVVADQGVGQLLAYIHTNPVRARVCDRPDDSAWTSHRAYVGLDAAPSWLWLGEGLRRAQAADGAAFDVMVGRTSGHPVLGEVASDEHLEQLVDAYERDRVAELRAARIRPVVDATALVARVARELGVPIAQLRSGRRGQEVALGRGIVIACGVRLGCPSRSLADALALTPQSVNRILRRAPLAADERGIAARVMTAVVGKRSRA